MDCNLYGVSSARRETFSFTVRVKQRPRASKNRVLRENIWTEDKESRRRMEKVYVRIFLTCNLRRILLR